MSEHELVIGLEVHAELLTNTKIFCSCATRFGDEINSNCCPVCLGMPGTLPVLNKKAVEYAITAGLAMNCAVAEVSRFDRKNYYYPDLPKSYQITQYDMPICTGGYLEIESQGRTKKIRIARIQIEEDAGKLLHDKFASDTLIDYNRAGVPLIEIVTEPDMNTAEEARSFLEAVKSILKYIGVSDCKMENGSLRADVNISLKSMGYGSDKRTEMKNLNSFRAIVRAIESEFERQVGIAEAGGDISRETRRWDDEKGASVSMRSKEKANDYRYFPEPDLPNVLSHREWVDEIRKKIPELPHQRKARYIKQFGLSEYDANLLTENREISDFFESAAEESGDPKSTGNWITGEMARIIRVRKSEDADIPFSAGKLAKLIKLINTHAITTAAAKKVLEIMFETEAEPGEIVLKMDLATLKNENEISGIVGEVIKENPDAVADYVSGKKKAIGFLMGRAMRKAGGRADPKMLGKILQAKLDKN